MPLTAKIVAFTDSVKALLDAEANDLGLKGVSYGPQQLHREYPFAEVESFPKDRRMRAQHQFGITLRCGITIIYGQIQSTEINRRESELLAEAIEDKLAQDPKRGGLVIFSFVSRIEPGFTQRGSDMLRATRLIYEGTSSQAF